MSWVLGRFWDVVIVSAVVALIGGAALMQAAMSTGGTALGQGLSGAVTFVKQIGSGFKEADKVGDQLNPPPAGTGAPASPADPAPGSAIPQGNTTADD